jgi:Zn-dependent protease/CBS domain-containing protein
LQPPAVSTTTPARRRWSWRIGRIVGIDVYVHATFPLLFVWIAVNAFSRGASVRTVVATLVLTLAVFVVVVLHECGHALTARRFGVQTRDITLLPIGGIARLERMPREPRQELLIALAGPAVNIAIAAALYAVLALTGVTAVLPELAKSATAVTVRSALTQLLAINVWLAAFNLIPAFPMDGGRVLRAILAMRSRDYAKATTTAARVGRVFALVFALVGIFWLESPLLALIAVFVWIAAASEAVTVQTSAALEDVAVSGIMMTDVRTLTPNETLLHAAELTIDGFQRDFPVVMQGTFVGMLTHRDLLRGLAQRGSDATVADAMQREFPTASVDDPADVALQRLTAMRGAALPVLRGQELVGVVTAENVSEFLSLRAAAGGNGRPRQ